MLSNKTWIILVSLMVIIYCVEYLKSNEPFAQEGETLYILTRTSGRPGFFKKSRESLKTQTNKNWHHIISTDDEESYDYASKDDDRAMVIKVKKTKKDDFNNCPYNLYFNELMKKVPNNSWVIFLDDDSVMTSAKSLENLKKAIEKAEKNNKEMIISKVTYGEEERERGWACQNKSMEEIKTRLKKDWWGCRIDTAQLAIKKTDKMASWQSQCAGDVRFLNDNIDAGYEIFFNNSEPIIYANYKGQGKGKKNDIN